MVSFLATRNIKLVDEKEDVLHYFGSSYRELKSLVKADKPDLVVIHHPDFYVDEDRIQWFHYVIDPITCDNEIYLSKNIRTNNAKLCQIYYRKLGLMRTMDVFYREPKEPASNTFEFIKNKVYSFMLWK